VIALKPLLPVPPLSLLAASSPVLTEAPNDLVEIKAKNTKSNNALHFQNRKTQNSLKENSADKRPEYIDYVEGIESYVAYQGPLKTSSTGWEKESVPVSAIATPVILKNFTKMPNLSRSPPLLFPSMAPAALFPPMI